jgi:dolichol-phosphate mannosyltransferase
VSEPVFSVIAPIYNELENLPLLYARVKEVMDSTGEAWELILVDDGSSDGSTDVMRKLAAEDERVRPVIFARNFGHQIAVTAGMDYSRGQAVTIIDADLQDPPEVILDLIAKWREG